jgi:dTDP-4-amino-4,6-dideoxygalactose transaminase
MNHPAISIPFHRPSIGQEEIDEVVSTLRSGWLTSGPRTRQFENEFRQYVDSGYALAVNSCTAALHLALAALRLTRGDEVITTPITFCATVNTILHVGAIPVLADIRPDGNIDPALIAERITERTRAIVPVHLGGLPCRMDQIWSIARRYGLRVVEDAAHAAGSQFLGCPIGSDNQRKGECSDAVAFSFYATKNITTGEGGMLTCRDQELLECMRRLCLHGISSDAWNRYSTNGKWYYRVHECGFKYNLSDIQSAIGIHQLRKLEGFIEVRKRYADRYNRLFEDIEEIEVPPDASDCRHSWHLYMLRLNLEYLEIDRAEFINLLAERGIAASVHFIPIQMHSYFTEYANKPQNHCPQAMLLYPRLVSLPLYPAMTEEQVDYVAAAVKAILRSSRKVKRVSFAAV